MIDHEIWNALLDGRYLCKVERTAMYFGQLTVVDTAEGEELLSEEVDLSYGARFGPDASDVSHWEDMCADAVDGSMQLGNGMMK